MPIGTILFASDEVVPCLVTIFPVDKPHVDKPLSTFTWRKHVVLRHRGIVV